VTLVELVIVVAILGILAGVALPRTWIAVERHRVLSAAHRVAADLRHARREAIQRSTSITVAFYPDSDHYQIDALADLDHASRSFLTYLARDYPGVDLDSARFGGAVVATFDHYGRPSAAGTVRLARGNSVAEVVVDEYGDVSIAL
jgi:Tfp pilus assembly protein FimT